MSTQIVKVPDIGGAEDIEVIEICVSVGDKVAQEDSLIVLESDKASMEIPSPFAGMVVSINVALGDGVAEGDILLELDNSAEEAKPTASAKNKQAAPVVEPPVEPPILVNEATEPDPAGQAGGSAPATGPTFETVSIPDIGGAEDAEAIEICVSTGDDVEKGDSLVVLETDKASMEVPAPIAGKVVSITMKEGDMVAEGDVILKLELSGASAQETVSKPVPEPVSNQQSEPQTSTVDDTSASTPTEDTPSSESGIPVPSFASSPTAQRKPLTEEAERPRHSTLYAGPAVRKLARELGVDLTTVKGSGPKGRIAKDDVKTHVKSMLHEKRTTTQGAGIPAVPSVDFSAFGDVSEEPFSKIQKLTAANMQRNWLNIPHVTQFDEVDISDLESFRQSLKGEAEIRGVKITPLPFLLKACAYVLKTNPKFNASLHSDGEHLVFKKYVHIGVAVDTPAGLVVPVIRDVDKKSIWELARESAELATKAKDRKLKPQEMQGGCFTISSLGGIGGQGFTPIVNAPEVGILGVSKLTTKPVWNGSEFVPRKMLPLALSYDHRAINGVDGGKFLTALNQLLADIRRLVL